MTREEAIKEWIIPALKNTWNDKKIAEILKALEQEPKSEWEQDHELLKAYSDGANDILDKIRAEITNIPITDTDGHNNNWYREPQAIINDVLQIIDKYKAESENAE